jgi:hypothetical protein
MILQLATLRSLEHTPSWLWNAAPFWLPHLALGATENCRLQSCVPVALALSHASHRITPTYTDGPGVRRAPGASTHTCAFARMHAYIRCCIASSTGALDAGYWLLATGYWLGQFGSVVGELCCVPGQAAVALGCCHTVAARNQGAQVKDATCRLARFVLAGRTATCNGRLSLWVRRWRTRLDPVRSAAY